jgi:hypothetical protein
VLLLESLNNCIKIDPSKVLSLGAMKVTLAILLKFAPKKLRDLEPEDQKTIANIKRLAVECLAGLRYNYSTFFPIILIDILFLVHHMKEKPKLVSQIMPLRYDGLSMFQSSSI